MRRSDGISFQVSINIFDEASRDLILKYGNSRKKDDLESNNIDSPRISFEEINKILGNTLFVDNSLWDDDPSEVASRLR